MINYIVRIDRLLLLLREMALLQFSNSVDLPICILWTLDLRKASAVDTLPWNHERHQLKTVVPSLDERRFNHRLVAM